MKKVCSSWVLGGILTAHFFCPIGSEAQTSRSPEFNNHVVDCIPGDWPTPTVECGKSVVVTRSIERPASGGGRACDLEQRTIEGPSCPPQCMYHAVRVYTVQYGNEISGTRSFFTGTVQGQRWKYALGANADADRVEFLPCVQEAIQSFANSFDANGNLLYSGHGLHQGYAVVTSSHAGRYSYVGNSSRNSDWGIILAVLKRLGLADDVNLKFCIFLPEAERNPGVNCIAYKDPNDIRPEDKVGVSDWALSENIYFDNECRTVSAANVQPDQVCGPVVTMAASGSPVSLILDESTDIDANATLVQFAIDPSKKGVYTWKASEGAPLLVWDPEKTGRITSATQLFGEWSFGGKGAPLRKSNVAMNAAPSTFGAPWKDGYEAMGSLDENGDNELSGRELGPIALWFDVNRNGVSEQGEVRSLNQSGVTRLFFTPDRVNPKTRSIHASRGYERLLNGKLVIGRSVDWYGEPSPSVGGMLDRLDAAAAYDGSSHTKTPDSTNPTTAARLAPAHAKALAGAWNWVINEPKESFIRAGATGNFVFAIDAASSELRGVTLQEQALYAGSLPSSRSLKSRMNIARLEHFKSIDKSTFSFQYGNPDGSKVVTEAKLEQGRLSGTSTFTRKGDTSITYGWVAQKVKAAPQG